MVEQIRCHDLTAQECGCGCGEESNAKQDCGWGRRDDLDGTSRQELVWVDSVKVAEMRQQTVLGACGCGCWCAAK